MKIKSKRHNNQRWMRCINADNLEDYVDIPVGGGSSPKLRLAVLKIADFLGGTWDNHPFTNRVRYDYYYLYRRYENGTFDNTGNGEYPNITCIGQHRDGDKIDVDRTTNKITNKVSIEEWVGRSSLKNEKK